MCGILGFKGTSTPKNVALVSKLILQSQIRGKHATGVSYLLKGGIKTLIKPSSALSFLMEHQEELEADLLSQDMIHLIGHTRYSTSGLEHNQPIYDEQLSIAMNGVVTQADAQHWGQLYGFKPRTTNDTEIVHKFLLQGSQPLSELGTASMAVVGLWSSGKMFAFRNARRPAWMSGNNDCIFVASTKDVISRATGLEPKFLKAGVVFQFSPSGYELLPRTMIELEHDLQQEGFDKDGVEGLNVWCGT